MKRTIILGIIAFLLIPFQIASADWASRFVVYSNDIYELTDEGVNPNEIGKKVGEVTRYSDHEGTYRGNFSNTFPKGTSYFSIKDIDPKEVIAVKTIENTYLKAMNKGHYDNDLLEKQYRYWSYLLIGVLILVISILIIRRQKRTT